MNHLLLHPATEQRLETYLQQPSHAITLVAPSGSGKHSLALYLTSRLLSVEPDKIANHAYVRIINSVDGKAIGVESIRELEHFLSLRVPNHDSVQRVVIIEDAHLLTIEAQNAFLKTLEEPPVGTVILLTSAQQQALLPTIRSRSPDILINRPDLDSARAYFLDKYGEESGVKQAVLISGGLPGLTDAILSQASDHPLLPATEKARLILGQTTYERLAQVDELARNRTLCLDTLFILQQMAQVSLQTAQTSSAARWQNIMTSCYEAQDKLLQNAQAKLVLTDLMLHL